MSGFPCIGDATCSDRLAALKRAHPEDWWIRLGRAARAHRGHRHTVEGWLRGGAGGALIPRDAKDAAALDRRKAARRWLPFVAGFALGQVTERCLRQIVHLRAMERVPLSRDTWVRDCGLLRRWIRQGQLARHRRALLAPRWRTIPGGERRRPAAAALIPIQVQRLLRGARCPRLRVMIALAYGCQLLPREFEALRFEDLAMDYAHVVVATASRRGRAGVTCRKRVWLPAWVRDLARGAWGEMPRASGWCFAHARRPGEHRRNSDGLLRSLGRRVSMEGVTFTRLRRSGQAIARARGCSRVVVRGVVPAVLGRESVEERWFSSEQQRFASSWSELLRPPADPGRLPRRAPGGCGLDVSERMAARRRARAMGWGRAEAPALPTSCEWVEPGEAVVEAEGLDREALMGVIRSLLDERTVLAGRLARERRGGARMAQRGEAAVARDGERERVEAFFQCMLWGGSGLLTGMALEQHLRSRRVPGGPTEGERLGAVAAGLVRGLAVEISQRCGLRTTG